MKRFAIVLLSVIFVALIACSVQSIHADHILKDGKGIFKDQNAVNLVRLGQEDSKYNIHLLVEVRTAQGQLISISEASHSQIKYIGYEMMSKGIEDLGKKEIITIDGIKYEKVQHVFTSTLQPTYRTGPFFSDSSIELIFNLAEDPEMNKKIRDYSIWKIQYCADFSAVGHDGYKCIPVFQVLVPTTTLEPDDVITQQWTILRELTR